MKKFLFIFFGIILFSFTGSLVKAQNVTPEIISVTPDEVNWGNYLTISGSNFGNNRANANVLFDGVDVYPNEVSDSEIRISISGYLEEIYGDRKIESIDVSIWVVDMGWLQANKFVSINVKPVIEFVWQTPKKDSLQSGDLMYIQGPLIKPAQDKIYIDGREASWDLSNTSSIPQNAMNKPAYYGQGFFKLPNNLSSADSIKIVTSDGVESDISLLSKFGHSFLPLCMENSWSCSDWSSCSISGTQTRTCEKTINCQGGVSAPATSQFCSYVPQCTSYSWSCSSWSACSSNGVKTKTCNKISNCEGGTPSPATTQSCAYTPVCSTDTWQCNGWGACSPQGIQARSCSRVYDCPSVETAAPATSQYCESSYQQNYQTPSTDSSIVVNQDAIIRATVKLVCPVSSTRASQGSGTVINSTGLILTNKHVIDGTAGCWVGFIDDYDDEPYFGDRQIADIYKVSGDADVAVLKLRNPNNKILTSVSISQSNSSSIQLGEILTTYGYPAKFGTKITYTSGDFSGVDGDYLKTTAIIEHGNSGGGAYLKNGLFIGIPTAVVKGSLNSMGYLLSVNKVNSWLNNSIAYNYNSNNNNNYSRVSSMLEDMDLSAISSLGLFIAGDEANIKAATESQKVIAEERNLITKIDNNLSKRVSGNILLQVEKNGEGWYVNPDNKKKYYLGRPADAFSIMRNLGLGIKHSELNDYLNSKFPSRLSGKILLDVEQNGEAYYVNPDDLKGYYLNRPADAFRVMRELGLGITNNDIRKIDVGEIE